MSLYYQNESNLFQEYFSDSVNIPIKKDHPWLTAEKNIPWDSLLEQARAIVYKGKKESKGRHLYLRAHCGIYLLQTSMDWTDREAEDMIRNHAMVRIFCGLSEYPGKSIDHTRIEKFRNQRLGLEGVETLNKYLLKVAKNRGFTNGRQLDTDTTVQEAGITYPTEMKLMKKFQERVRMIAKQCIGLPTTYIRKLTKLRKEGQKLFRHYSLFLRDKAKSNIALQKKELMEKMRQLSQTFLDELTKISQLKDGLKIRPYIRKEMARYLQNVPRLLSQIESWLKTGQVAVGKIISLHKSMPSFIKKGKLGKPTEIGRKIIINQYLGGFLQVFLPEKTNPSDQKTLKTSIQGAMRTFGERIDSIGTDRGYSSAENIKRCKKYHIAQIGIQPRGKSKWEVNRETARELFCRRAAIEPRIGLAGKLGLKLSRAKTDLGDAIYAHRAVTGFNLRKLVSCFSRG